MRYTWDPDKDALNRRKHGLSLEEGIPALDDPNGNSWFDDRFEYGEDRIITLGLGRKSVLYVVTVLWDENLTRIISVRRANGKEIKQYDLGRP